MSVVVIEPPGFAIAPIPEGQRATLDGPPTGDEVTAVVRPDDVCMRLNTRVRKFLSPIARVNDMIVVF
jgi:hypothetical protein